ncbi:hypothetical protein BC939DRAFT_479847 [Gamsiella multidivaricata]|uniref:uncharacterized protein n=1 Tax=Gamsiella multidivaricata TaxID=101098 RepID=UPI00221E7522|nr:uncharacterized protein BC939DRAFT_479847 [Gamsiella multidivaricata]KAI7819183.1 hypothetical protein BC939DRAFT_479847 [Gamsiella multidivaricata]
MTMAGRSHSDPSSTSSFLARLKDSISDESEGHTPKDQLIKLMPPPMARSRTFTGSTSTVQVDQRPFFLAPSPFSTLDTTRRLQAAAPSFKTARPTTKRLGQAQDLLRQMILVRPSMTRSRSLSFQSMDTSMKSTKILSKASDWQRKKAAETNKNDGTKSRSTSPAVESCTAAMDSLSPPSTKPSTPFTVRIRRRSSITNTTTSLSLPLQDITDSLCSDSDDDDAGRDEDLSPNSSSARPRDVTAAMAMPEPPKRPMILRRHQTMISSRSEFMRTLEVGTRQRSICQVSAINKKPMVFAAEGYIPDPLREDCRILPCANFASKPDDTTKRITPQTVADLLDGKYEDQYDLLYIIDCRFPYEFEGGHIKSAVNVNTTDKLEELLLQPAITDKRVLLVFHCEFSCERGPRMARHLRTQDRAANASHYPAVFYPEVYVMQGGYSGFFKKNKSYCWPEAYVEMQDEKHSQEFQHHMRTFGREFSRTASKGFLGTESNTKSSCTDAAMCPSPLKSTLGPASTAQTTATTAQQGLYQSPLLGQAGSSIRLKSFSFVFDAGLEEADSDPSSFEQPVGCPTAAAATPSARYILETSPT